MITGIGTPSSHNKIPRPIFVSFSNGGSIKLFSCIKVPAKHQIIFHRFASKSRRKFKRAFFRPPPFACEEVGTFIITIRSVFAVRVLAGHDGKKNRAVFPASCFGQRNGSRASSPSADCNSKFSAIRLLSRHGHDER